MAKSMKHSRSASRKSSHKASRSHASKASRKASHKASRKASRVHSRKSSHKASRAKKTSGCGAGAKRKRIASYKRAGKVVKGHFRCVSSQ